MIRDSGTGEPEALQRRFARAFYLTGPTGVGKTAVSLELARLLGAEIVALDSMTLYRGMDIGTAKPTPPERSRVPHHLIDVLDPWQEASVADYRQRAAAVLAELEARGVPALFVGGTPLYLKVLLRGLFDGPPGDEIVRRALEQAAIAQGDLALHRRLAQVDPAAAARIAPADRRRVIRALEVHALTGRPLTAWQTGHGQPARDVCVAALARPRALLHARIDARVAQMFRDGLVAEVEALGTRPRPLSRTARQAVGYAEVIAHLAGDVALGPTVARIQARTRQFAKRQETWFRGLAEVRSWPVGSDEPPARTAADLAAWLVTATS